MSPVAFWGGFYWNPSGHILMGEADLQEKGRQRGQVHEALLALCPEIINRALGFFLMVHPKWVNAFIPSPGGAEDLERLPGREVLLMKVPVAVVRCSDRWKAWDINEVPNNFQSCTK